MTPSAVPIEGTVQAVANVSTGKLYRFELAFDGEPQGVGLLTGLEATGLSPAEVDKLVKMFDALPVPRGLDDVQVAFWFTPVGVLEFSDAIVSVIQAIEPHGWTVLMSVIDQNATVRFYADEYQVALPRQL